jgi:hypothetical protein
MPGLRLVGYRDRCDRFPIGGAVDLGRDIESGEYSNRDEKISLGMRERGRG